MGHGLQTTLHLYPQEFTHACGKLTIVECYGLTVRCTKSFGRGGTLPHASARHAGAEILGIFNSVCRAALPTLFEEMLT